MSASFRWSPTYGGQTVDATWHNGGLTIVPRGNEPPLGVYLIQARTRTVNTAIDFMVSIGISPSELAASKIIQEI